MEHKHFVWLWLIVIVWATAALVATEFWRVDKGQEALWIAVFCGWALIVFEFQQLRKKEKEEEKEWEGRESEMYARKEELEEQEREMDNK
jgi:4-hydroxybenzoate polyprenyltransferase